MSGGIGQLLKGVVMGVVLILAIIGTMSMLDKNKVNDNGSPATNLPSNATNNAQTDIKAPEINIALSAAASKNSSVTATEKNNNFEPLLEGEKNVQKIEKQEQAKLQFGILKLSTINPDNKNNLLSDYEIFNNENKRVATSNNSSSASYRLAEGSYKVIATLSQSNESSTRNVEPVQSIQNILISASKLTEAVFEVTPPPTIGILQVSVTNAKSKQPMRANFIIQQENGKTIASRKDITNTFFKLKAGSYKVTVSSGNNSDFRTIVIEPGKSIIEVFKLQESSLQGKVLVRIFDTHSNNAVPADIEISTENGEIMQTLKAVSQTEIALIAGNYKIKVSDQKGESSKNITVTAGQNSSHTFRIDPPEKNITESVKINNNVKISGVNNTDETTPESTTKQNIEPTSIEESSLGKLKLFALNNGNQKPIKSNFYVQTPNGVNIAKRIYADKAEFNLKPGKYKITIRSKNRKNIVKNIRIYPNQATTETFSLVTNLSRPTTQNTQNSLPNRVLAPQKPIKTPNSIPNGFLNITMQPAKNTHFIISDRKGKKVVELTSVPSGNFKLDSGIYIVTAILNGQRRKQTIQVYQGKTSLLNFNTNDFKKKTTYKTSNNNSVLKGILRSRIIDNSGRPLRGDLTVKNLRGQIVAQANNVTVGVFNLPAVPYTISVNYQGLSGSERVNITTGKTTIQTFTISSNNSNSNPAKPARTQQSRDANDILRDKLKEELRRIF
jgi:uncharacterized protein (DUF2141 family)